MGIFRSTKPTIADRPSLKIHLTLTHKQGQPLDPSEAWEALKAAFKDHPLLAVHQALVTPSKDDEEALP